MSEGHEMALRAIIEICRKDTPISKDASVIVNIAELALDRIEYISQTDVHGNVTYHRGDT